jgi:hypothetical protein
MNTLFIGLVLAVGITLAFFFCKKRKAAKELSVIVSHDTVAGHGTQHKGTNRDESDD